MGESSETLVRTIFEQATIGRFQLFLKALETRLVPETLSDKDGNSLLHLAVWAGDSATVAEVLRLYPSQMTLTSTSGTTPLMLAAARGDLSLMRTLIQSGADLHAKDTRGADCMLVAVENNQGLALLCLYWSGCDWNSVDDNRCGIAHWAGYYDAWRVMELIVSLGLDLQGRDSKGFTPLHRAALTDSTRTASSLLHAQIDPSICDSSGCTAYQLAIANNSLGVAGVIQRKQPWSPGLKTYYAYMVLTALYYWVYVVPWTAQYLFPSLVFVNAFAIAMFCFWSLSKAETKLQGSDLDSLKAAFQAGDIVQFGHQDDFCFRCLRRKPTRTHHCSICGHCVPNFNQHSTLFNACIGDTQRGRYCLGITCFLIAISLLIYLDWLSGVWGNLLDGEITPILAVMPVGQIAVWWCLLWEWTFEVRAILQGLTVYENLHKDKCRYLFSTKYTSKGRQISHFSNPFDHGKIRNCVFFISNSL